MILACWTRSPLRPSARDTASRVPVCRRLTGLALALVLAAAAPAAARIVVPEETVPDDVRPVLERLRQAFVAGDHEDLAALMHPDGVTIGMGPEPDRTSLMTPAQAFYYFKHRFQQQRTIRFGFVKHQLSGPDRLHAVSVWRWERTDTGRDGDMRLLLTLVRSAAGWRVTELTALRSG